MASNPSSSYCPPLWWSRFSRKAQIGISIVFGTLLLLLVIITIAIVYGKKDSADSPVPKKPFTKLLVGIGQNFDVEIVDLENEESVCQNLKDFPLRMGGAIGGLGFQNEPIICGGNQNGESKRECYSYINESWVITAQMNQTRSFFATSKFPTNGNIFVSGGGYKSEGSTTEIFTENGWQLVEPNMPLALEQHCMVTVNATTIAVIGGRQNFTDYYNSKTFFFNILTNEWTRDQYYKIGCAATDSATNCS